mgnify:FL=1
MDDHENKIVVGVVSDTHGYLDDKLLEALGGSDIIVHAGDICSRTDYERLCKLAPVYACLGNNDYSYAYGPEVRAFTTAHIGGLRWMICHYRERIDPRVCDVAICGHTHRPFIKEEKRCLIMNPGSPTFPRTILGPTCGRIVVSDGSVVDAEIIQLDPPGADK